MNQVKKETITVRSVSVAFSAVALGVFKPFGLDTWHWDAWLHLLVIWFLGMVVCFLTEQILKYIIRMPGDLERGVGYIIRRNLWFQLINTPLIALMVCLYRHFVLSKRVAGNQLSWANFFETLIIFAFISFSIGLFWRFKFRSRYLALELEETRKLNRQLKTLQQAADKQAKMAEDPANHQSKALQQPSVSGTAQLSAIVLKGTTSETVALQVSDLIYIEAVGNYVKVYHVRDGEVYTDMLRSTSKQMEDQLRQYPMIVRCHRAFLVNLGQVEQIVSKSGSMQLSFRYCQEAIPVSRSNIPLIKSAVNAMAAS